MIILFNDTGYVGSLFSNYLIKKKFNYISINRKKIKDKLIKNEKFFENKIIGKNKKILIYNFFGEIRDRNKFDEFNVQFIKKLIIEINNLIKDNFDIKLVHISSASSIFHKKINFKNDYGFTKYLGDQLIIQNLSQMPKFKFTILKPGIIISDESKNSFIFLLKTIFKFKFYFFLDPSPKFLVTDIDDLISVLHKTSFQLTNEEINIFKCICLNELIKRIQKIKNVNLIKLNINKFFYKIIKLILSTNKHSRNLFLEYEDIYIDNLEDRTINKIINSI